MNKKIFAALASATMALSATGSLAVFAEDFDVVEENNNGNVSGSTTPSTKVVLNEENFPDANFRKQLTAWTGAAYGDEIKQTYLDTTNFALNYDSTDPAAGGKLDIKDLTGIEFFKNITTLNVQNYPNLANVNVESNTKLQNVWVTNCQSLETVKLPATDVLNTVDISGNTGYKAPITELDLSANKGLTQVKVHDTLVANIDLSNNPYLTVVQLDNNAINTLNLAGSLKIKELVASDNHLYSLELPSAQAMTKIDLHNNVLQGLDLPNLPVITYFDVHDNEIRDLDLTGFNEDCAAFDISQNHIGAIDLSDIAGSTNLTVTPQTIYLDSAYNTIDLADNFDNFDKDNLVKANVTGASYNEKTTVLSDITDGAMYKYTVKDGTTMEVTVVNADVLNRLYNPNSGEHFYTKDIEEKNTLVDLGWHDEGIGWTSPVKGNTPVYRLYNPNAGDHHYTKSSTERDVLTSVGWKYEGIGWYSAEGTYTSTAPATAKHTVDVYREYNPNAKAAGAHNYTTNEAENDFLVSVGWLEEGIAWKAMK